MGYDLNFFVNTYVRESANASIQLLQPGVEQLVQSVIGCCNNDKDIFLLGNGGTAGIMSNFYADLLIHPFMSEDKKNVAKQYKRLRIHNLCDVSALTALTNDIGYENAFAYYIGQCANSGDLLISASGSGTSKNVVNAINRAKDLNVNTCLITKNAINGELLDPDILITFDGESHFPGQTGGNNFNFHFEDLICKLSHVISGILKEEVNNGLD